jgi:predicted RNA-binding Zn-ribbon protein involved in translation (DUF1610 family)
VAFFVLILCGASLFAGSRGWAIIGVVLWTMVVGCPLAGTAVGVIVSRLPRPTLPGVCLSCGYDLRGSKGACPECGAERPGRSEGGRDLGVTGLLRF